MALVRWSPFQDLDAVERRMRHVFDQVGSVPGALVVHAPKAAEVQPRTIAIAAKT